MWPFEIIHLDTFECARQGRQGHLANVQPPSRPQPPHPHVQYVSPPCTATIQRTERSSQCLIGRPLPCGAHRSGTGDANCARQAAMLSGAQPQRHKDREVLRSHCTLQHGMYNPPCLDNESPTPRLPALVALPAVRRHFPGCPGPVLRSEARWATCELVHCGQG